VIRTQTVVTFEDGAGWWLVVEWALPTVSGYMEY